MKVPCTSQYNINSRTYTAPDHVRNLRDAEGRFLLEYTLKFTRPLTEVEKFSMLRHYLDGLESYNADDVLKLVAIDASKDDVYKITFHQFAVDHNRVLFALYATLKDKFPLDRYAGE